MYVACPVVWSASVMFRVSPWRLSVYSVNQILFPVPGIYPHLCPSHHTPTQIRPFKSLGMLWYKRKDLPSTESKAESSEAGVCLSSLCLSVVSCQFFLPASSIEMILDQSLCSTKRTTCTTCRSWEKFGQSILLLFLLSNCSRWIPSSLSTRWFPASLITLLSD